MKDTIGWHLNRSMWYVGLLSRIGSRLYLAGDDIDDDKEAQLRMAQQESIGRAAGHAFRAAELAYDMGHDHGRRARSVAHMWADIANADGGFTPDVGVFTAPEPGFYRLGSGDTKHMVAGESVRLSQRTATHISAEIHKAGIVSGSVDDFNRKMREERDRRSVKVESGILTSVPDGAIVMGENAAGEEREIKIGDRFDETVVRFRLLMNLRSKP